MRMVTMADAFDAVLAQALKLPVTTVKVKVHRARLKLMHARENFQEVRP